LENVTYNLVIYDVHQIVHGYTAGFCLFERPANTGYSNKWLREEDSPSRFGCPNFDVEVLGFWYHSQDMLLARQCWSLSGIRLVVIVLGLCCYLAYTHKEPSCPGLGKLEVSNGRPSGLLDLLTTFSHSLESSEKNLPYL
jgi:hypothetical protein